METKITQIIKEEIVIYKYNILGNKETTKTRMQKKNYLIVKEAKPRMEHASAKSGNLPESSSE